MALSAIIAWTGDTDTKAPVNGFHHQMRREDHILKLELEKHQHRSAKLPSSTKLNALTALIMQLH